MVSQHACGLMLATLGTLSVSFDSVLLRMTERHGGWVWSTVLLKTLVGGILTLVPAVAAEGRQLPPSLRTAPASLAVAVVLQALVAIGFPVAILLTGAARALLLISLNPLWAALLGRVVLGEQLPLRTALALLAALVATLLVFLPPLLMGEEARGPRESLRGDAVALATGVVLAAFVNANRWLAKHRPHAPTSVAAGTGTLLAAVATLAPALQRRSDFGQLDLAFYGYVVLDALVVALCSVLTLVLAPRYIRGPEVAMVLLLEVALGPLWVLLAVGEVPSTFTFVGGALLLATLFVHELLGLRASDPATQAASNEKQKEEEGVVEDCSVEAPPKAEI